MSYSIFVIACQDSVPTCGMTGLGTAPCADVIHDRPPSLHSLLHFMQMCITCTVCGIQTQLLVCTRPMSAWQGMEEQ